MRAVAFLVAGVLVLGASLYVDFLALFAIGLASSDSGKPVEPLEWLVFAIIAIGGLLLAAWVVRLGRRRPRG